MYRLKDLREDKDLKQNDLAKLIGCSQATYSRYETEVLGLPIDVLIKLSKFYNVSIEYVLGLTKKKK